MKRDNSIFPYIVVLRQKYRFLIGITGIIASLIFLLSLIIRVAEYPSTRIVIIPVLIVSVVLFIQQFQNYRLGKKTAFRYLFFLAAITLLIVPPFQLWFFLYIVLALLEKPASTPEEIGFSDDKIVFNGIWKRQISWNDLSNVVLKDGIITLDYKNNKLSQKETDDDEDDEEYDVSEEEFNEYCQRMLNKHLNSTM